MLYVQQSLGPDEELVHIGKFHWMYTMSSSMWLLIGVVLSCVALYGGYYYEVYMSLRNIYSDNISKMPDDLFNRAWDEEVNRMGGMIHIIREQTHPFVRIGAFVSFLMGLYMFAQMMIVKATTEIAITNTRLIYKQGLIARHVGEISIDRIEGVNVLQGILGRILNYGNVIVRGMGVGEVMLPPIEDPVAFRRAIDKARTL